MSILGVRAGKVSHDNAILQLVVGASPVILVMLEMR